MLSALRARALPALPALPAVSASGPGCGCGRVQFLSQHVPRSTDSRASPQLNAGRGGYSSNKGVVATIFGATGFVGRYVVDQLASKGITCIVPYRGDDMEPRHLKLMGDLGRVNPLPFDPRVVDSVRAVVRPAHLVVNLIGKDWETKHVLGSLTKNYTYEQCNAEVPRVVAQVAREQGVQQLVHFSSLAARPDAVSRLDQAKHSGELAVRAHFPDATIVKPANIFGDEDRFMNKIARHCSFFPIYSMVERGAQMIQPVYVNDVAKAIGAMVQNPDVVGKTLNLAGPEVMSMKELTEFVLDVCQRNPTVLDLPTPVLQAIGTIVEQFPNPRFTADQMMQQINDNIVPEGEVNHLPELLGHEPSALDHVSYRFLHQYRAFGHFLHSLD